MTRLSREGRYRKLVRQRKADSYLSKYNLINPSETNFDCKELGSYALWAGDLHADLLVAMTDSRTVEKYIDHRGKPACCNPEADHGSHWQCPANGFLLQLLRSINRDIGLPQEPLPARVFIADAVPFRGMTSANYHTKFAALRYCTETYLAPLIALIQPRVVVSVGVGVTNALFEKYAPVSEYVFPECDMNSHAARVHLAPFSICGGNVALFPVFHPGYPGQMVRGRGENCKGFEAMLRDWARVKEFLMVC